MNTEDEKAAFRDQQQHLKDLINQSITPCRLDNRREVVAEQTRLLDLAFRNFISIATNTNVLFESFALAFKAQQQCRQTMQFLNHLGKLEKHGNHQQKP